MAKIPNFVGLKFTSRDCCEAGSCLRLKRPNGKPYHFFFGSDETYLGHHAFGIESAIGSSYNFAPQLFHQINQALKNNDVAKAQELQKVVTEMFEVLFKHGKVSNPLCKKSEKSQNSLSIEKYFVKLIYSMIS